MDSIAGFPTDSLHDLGWIAWYVWAAATPAVQWECQLLSFPCDGVNLVRNALEEYIGQATKGK